MKHQHTLRMCLAMASISLAFPLFAQSLADGQVRVMDKKVIKDGNAVKVDIDFSLSQMKLKSNKGIILIPMIVNEADTARMPAVEIMGRKRYIYYQRNGKTATPYPAIVQRRLNGEEQDIYYQHVLNYEPWMKNSQLVIGLDKCGCNQTIVGENLLSTIDDVLKEKPKPIPILHEKQEITNTQQMTGSAHLKFPIGKYDIVPSLDQNQSELKEIMRVINLVKSNKNVRITAITLHGYASPDGKYSLNEKLAYNRTRALHEYLKKQYPAENHLFEMTSTAEDWEGVRRYVEENEIPQRQKVLDILNNDGLTPDQKEQAIRSKAPQAHKHLLQNLYPSLRRTDYTVSYEIISKSWR